MTPELQVQLQKLQEFNDAEIKPVFKHWKGNRYLFLHTKINSTSGLQVILYRSLDNGLVYERTLEDVFGTTDTGLVRFTYTGEYLRDSLS